MRRSKLFFSTLAVLAVLAVLGLRTTSTAYAQYDCAGQNEVAVEDCEALIALYQATTVNGPWDHDSGFWQAVDNDPNNDLPLSQWATRDPVEIENGRVAHVNLWGNNLNGALPDAICDLEALRELDLDINKLTGTIPACIGQMAALEKLSIQQFEPSNLEGTLPASLGDLANLKELTLPGHTFTGPIPASLGNLANLEILVLGGSLGQAGNQLDGPIPASLGQLTKLTILDLRGNRLTGPIPASLGNLSNLQQFWAAGGNQLSGLIPASLGRLSRLEILRLDLNALTGFEEGSYDGWTSLQDLRLAENQLENVPDLSGLTSLTTLRISRNALRFDDLEPLAGFVGQIDFRYESQASVALRVTEENGLTVLWMDAGGDATVYEWVRRDEATNSFVTIPDSTDARYTVSESGRYGSRARHPQFPDLTLFGPAIDVEVDGCPVGKAAAGCGFIVNVPVDTGFPLDANGDPDLPDDGLCDVDPNTDDNQCSLRAALQLTNAGFGKNSQAPVVITFAIPDDATIQLAGALPEITKPVEILGSTQNAGFVVVQGEGKSFDGLVIREGGQGSTIEGLNLSDFSVGIQLHGGGENNITKCVIMKNSTGIQIEASSHNIIRENVISENAEDGIVVYDPENQIIDNKIGIDEGGTQPRGNGGHGIRLNGASNTTIRGNVISSNEKDAIISTEASGLIERNLIGTDQTGTLGLPNKNGIELLDAFSTTIRDNTISGNSGIGVYVYFGGDNTISDNVIGLDSSGTVPVPNKAGIILHGAGSSTVQDNVISSNIDTGIIITVRNRPNTIISNKIGTDITGTLPRGNGANGVVIDAPETSVLQNVIAANGENGIRVLPQADSTRIQDNKIGSTVQGGLDDDLLIANRGNGVRADQVEDIEISNNLIAYNLGRGVLLRHARKGTVWQNTIQENSHGIEIDDGQAIRVTRNTIQGNRESGVLLDDLLRGDVRSNTIQDNRYGIANDGGQDINMDDNTIQRNSESGILLRDAGGGTLWYNTISHNQYGIEIDGGQAVTISNNDLYRNLKKAIFARDIGDVEQFTSLTIVGNEIVQTQSATTGIHLLKAHARIAGNIITEDVGDAIKLEDGSTAQMVGNNIFGNAGMGLNNLTPSVMVTANDNWWGDASGPGGQGPGSGDEVSAGVDVSSWLGEMVAVVVSAERDEILLPIGEADTVSVFVQNWQRRDDALDLTISDTQGWLQSPATLTVTLDDSTGAEARLVVAVPTGTPDGATSTVNVTAVSQADDSHTATTSFTLRAESAALAEVLVLPGTVNVAPGDTVQFDALGLDQFNRAVEIMPTWTATGGVIDSDGVYIAGETTGEFVVTATDPATGLSGTARVGNGVAVAVEEAGDVPEAFHLAPNYPNPFNAETTIAFTLPQPARVRLAVYDVLGREVAVLVDDALPPGTHQARFDASRLASGVYFYRLAADRSSQTRTMLLLR